MKRNDTVNETPIVTECKATSITTIKQPSKAKSYLDKEEPTLKVDGYTRLEEKLFQVAQFAGFESMPKLGGLTMTGDGQPLLPTIDKSPLDAPSETEWKLRPAQHLIRGGIISWNPSIMEMEDEANLSDYILQAITASGLLGAKMLKSPQYLRFIRNDSLFSTMVRKVHYETVLATIFSQPCMAHYYFYGFAYRRYVKSRSHRALMPGRFLNKEELADIKTQLAKIAEVKTEEGLPPTEFKVVSAINVASI